ncbi:MAG: tRNA lysidine(34) synthetase TilS [Erysipelotrichaceae bacterium]|nr:tRNA lysidine(34) synthetase TilS [Erysipelotrichaceae bacterium]MDY5252791.1 tRNA lysidine(34) synthetase TilS [Erysipelotrichaceae bacterium]
MNKEIRQLKWLIGCSGGPDSMALLAMAKALKMDIMVACVNYLKRESAYRDVHIVRRFCQKHDIPFLLLDKPYEYKGNFQAFARDYRYAFFKEIVDEYHLAGVLIAHHKDDLIETYMMQKNKQLQPAYWGLKQDIIIKGVRVYRPLLAYDKQDLENYCLMHKIPYGIDESNLTDDYARNVVRHQHIEKLSKKEKDDIINQIALENHALAQQQAKFAKMIDNGKFKLATFYAEEEPIAFLRYYFARWANCHLSNDHLKDITSKINQEGTFLLDIQGHMFNKSYETCEIVGKSPQEYNFVLQSYCEFETPYFKVSQSGRNIDGVSVKEDDFPLTITNAKPGDKIKMRFGHKKLSRFFIDRKISLLERQTWPVVKNRHGEIILVPGLGCDVAHYTLNHNLFVLKLCNSSKEKTDESEHKKSID